MCSRCTAACTWSEQDRGNPAIAAGSSQVVLPTSIAEIEPNRRHAGSHRHGTSQSGHAFLRGSGMSRLVTFASRAPPPTSVRSRRAHRTWYRLSVVARGGRAALQPFAAPGDPRSRSGTALALELPRRACGSLAGCRGWMCFLRPPRFPRRPALLRQLGAHSIMVRANSTRAEHGRLGTHPRLAHLLLRGGELGRRPTRLPDLAALLDERDPLRGANDPVAPTSARARRAPRRSRVRRRSIA